MVILGAGVGVVWWLLGLAGGSTQLQMEAVRTGATIAFGIGGLGTLLLFARRQWLQEEVHEHTKLTTENAEIDAEERRITDMYIQAVEQLGNDNAPVQLAGLYGLERLARHHPSHKQIVIDVITAFLRIPPITAPTSTNEPIYLTQRDDEELRIPAGHREVRLTAQRILAASLRRGFTSESASRAPRRRVERIDLNGAQLIDADFSDCIFPQVSFRGADFLSTMNFRRANFSGGADFTDARFHGPADFTRAHFGWHANFDYARFADSADFSATEFEDATSCQHAHFMGAAHFGTATMAETDFECTVFVKDVEFVGAVATGEIRMCNVTIQGSIWLDRVDLQQNFLLQSARVDGLVSARKARFQSYTSAKVSRFLDDVNLDGAVFDDHTQLTGARFHGQFSCENARFSRGTLMNVTFMEEASFSRTRFAGTAYFRGTQFHSHIVFNDVIESEPGVINLDGVHHHNPTVAIIQLPPQWEITADDGQEFHIRHTQTTDADSG